MIRPMREFDAGRACRMLSTALLAAWALLALGAIVDVAVSELPFDDEVRFIIDGVCLVGSAMYTAWLVPGLALALVGPAHGLLRVYQAVAAATVVLSVVGAANQIPGYESIDFTSDWETVAAFAGGVVLGVVMFLTARARLASPGDAGSYSSPEENR
jgi:hypothetical protein